MAVCPHQFHHLRTASLFKAYIRTSDKHTLCSLCCGRGLSHIGPRSGGRSAILRIRSTLPLRRSDKARLPVWSRQGSRYAHPPSSLQPFHGSASPPTIIRTASLRLYELSTHKATQNKFSPPALRSGGGQQHTPYRERLRSMTPTLLGWLHSLDGAGTSIHAERTG